MTKFYIPANTLPITITSTLGIKQPDTIISGVIYFMQSGSWEIAAIIFIASVFVPLAKLFLLIFILLSVHFHSAWRARDRTVLYRLTEMVGRLGEDHERARRLAEGLAALPGVTLDPRRVRTNIVVLRLDDDRVAGPRTLPPSQRFVGAMRERGVLCGAFGTSDIRMVTHYEIGDADVDTALAAARQAMAA